MPGKAAKHHLDIQPMASTSKATLDITAAGSFNNNSKSVSATTLLISSLPSAYTSESLSALLSSIGPIRTAFVVSTARGNNDDQAHKQSKGYGFAKFVMRDDAERAISDLNGTLVDGRKISVTWAKRRQRGTARGGEAGSESEEDAVPNMVPESSRPAVRNVQNAYADRRQENRSRAAEGSDRYSGPHTAADNRKDARTIIIEGGLDATSAEDAKALRNRLKKAVIGINTGDGPLQLADVQIESGTISVNASAAPPAPANEDPVASETHQNTTNAPDRQSVTLLICPYAKVAVALAQKLHNTVLKGRLVLAKVKFESDLLVKKPNAEESRLIVRNLAFDVTALDIASVFAPYGCIHSIRLLKGFGFVHFLRRQDAQTALQKLNGTRVFAGIIQQRIDEAANHKLSSTVRKEQKGRIVGVRGRPMAVDWAINKKEFQKLENGDLGEAENSEKSKNSKHNEPKSYDSDTSDDVGSEGEMDKDEDMASEGTDYSEKGSEDEDIATDELESPDEDDQEHDETAPDQGVTLFVRNIQFEATEDELFALMKAFGPVRYARIVIDSVTNRSRGTGFVNFYKAESALACLEEAQRLAAQTGTTSDLSSRKDGKVTAQARSLLTVDPSSASAAKLTLHGRVLGISEAVSKGQADRLREDRDKSGQTKDKRNLYLMHEGTILPESPLAETLAAADVQARTSSFESRKGLLRTNPALYVSRTRLAIRQIPLFVTDGILRRLAGWAIKAFDTDVEKGRRSPLTLDELREPVAALGSATFTTAVAKEGSASSKAKAGKKPFFKGKDRSGISKVQQAKILRQDDRVDPLTGFKRSKGYGFLEMATHADALRVVRWANANRDVHKLLHKWWMEDLQIRIASLEEAEKADPGASVDKKRHAKKTNPEGDEDNLDSQARLKRMKDKLQELLAEGDKGATASRQGKTLIIEFSIENAMTVRRRTEKVEKARERSAKRKREVGDEGEKPSDPKIESTKPVIDGTASPTGLSPVTANGGKGSLGSMIGKKRRLAKQKRGKK